MPPTASAPPSSSFWPASWDRKSPTPSATDEAASGHGTPRDQVFRPFRIEPRIRRWDDGHDVPSARRVLEVHTHESVVRDGSSSPGWWTSQGGLFAPGPHIVLQQQRWLEESATTASRSFVLDASTGQVEAHSESLFAYSDDEYRTLLEVAGFAQAEIYPGFGGTTHPDQTVITARRPVGS